MVEVFFFSLSYSMREERKKLGRNNRIEVIGAAKKWDHEIQ